MKIVVLDGYALNPGDLSWEALNAIGEVIVYDRTPPALIHERAKDAEILFTNKTPLRQADLELLTQLKYIGVLATGYDVVDIKAAARKGIVVTNIPAYSTASVAQLTFALVLELMNQVGKHSDAVHQGAWSSSADFSFWLQPQLELAGKNFGIIGYGAIGEQVARIATAFGMHVLAHKRQQPLEVPMENFKWASRDEVLEQSDIISLHCPLTEQTEGMINQESLARMKQTAYLINTARGKLIVERDLADALNQGKIAGAGLDVLSTEPPTKDNPLLGARNCIITPHVAWATTAARKRLMDIAVENLQAFLAGQPVNQVN